jgi:glycosyltransferase involved in cell wall biosynthesis
LESFNNTLLFIKHKDFNARTVDNDLNILNENYRVTLKNINTNRGIGFFFSLFSQFWYLLFCIYKFKVVFIWFADYHSLLPIFFSKIFGKISVLNIGGYDADEILIGTPNGLKAKFRKFCVKYSVKNSTMLLPVSDVIKKYLTLAVPDSKCRTLYCCIDTELFNDKIQAKENLIITVGGGGKFVKEAKRKRLDFFIQLANEFNSKYPDYKAMFFLIGHNENTPVYEYLNPMIKSHCVELKPVTKNPEELNEYYGKASIYMQLSDYEAFGIAQVEAMYCGCIPVSNPGGAIPEVVGDAGFLIANYDIEMYIRTIKEVLDKKHEDLRTKAHNRAENNFTLEIRKKMLNSILNDLLNF